MKPVFGYRLGVTFTFFLLTATAYRDKENSDIFDLGFSGNCSNGSCDDRDDDDSKCPADSTLDPTEETCVCKTTHCYKPMCHSPAQLVLKKKATRVPGDCCDLYQCVSPHEKNCSGIVCPDETEECPEDSYRLPSYKSPADCCSTPQGCQCLPNSCAEGTCPDGERPRIVRPGNNKPGTCCPLYNCAPEKKMNDSCVINGSKVMANGSTWQKDPCIFCSCINGYQFCKASPASNCNENRGCISSTGDLYENGETWEDDACTQCTCDLGEKKCVAYMCEVSCANPRYVPGECCPECDGDGSSVVRPPSHCPDLNCSLRCLHGFVRDGAGCFTCECEDGPCLLECSNGFAHDARGHLLCECAESERGNLTSVHRVHCPSEEECLKFCAPGRSHSPGYCQVCGSCRNKNCKPLSGCDKFCEGGFATDEKGCLVCKCMEVETSKVEESQGGRCVLEDGRVRVHGETWHDGCRQCLCHEGREMCNLIICPRLDCVNPVFNSSSDCCAICPDDTFKEGREVKSVLCHFLDGTYKKEGEVWSVDRCMKCLCHKGRTLCETRECPPAPCPFPVVVEGDCCPYCPQLNRGGEESRGRDCSFAHPHGSTWRRGSCESCRCDNGQEICFAQRCEREKCAHPIFQKNECCGVCIENVMQDGCRVGNKTYKHSSEWMEDECTRCTCDDGRSMCTREICPNGDCANELRKPGSCCPSCPGKSLGKSHVKIFVYYIIITVLVLVIVSLLVSILVLCKRSRRYCVSCPDSESLPSFKTLSKPKFKYNSSDSDYTTEKEKFAIV